jgi:hypothetical protein
MADVGFLSFFGLAFLVGVIIMDIGVFLRRRNEQVVKSLSTN